METQAHDGVLELMERLLARARAALQDSGPEVPRLVPGLLHRLRKTTRLRRTSQKAHPLSPFWPELRGWTKPA